MLISAPVLLVSLGVGLVISIMQAATSIQEFTLSFVPKLIAIATAIVVALPWMIETMLTYTRNVIAQIPSLIR